MSIPQATRNKSDPIVHLHDVSSLARYDSLNARATHMRLRPLKALTPDIEATPMPRQSQKGRQER